MAGIQEPTGSENKGEENTDTPTGNEEGQKPANQEKTKTDDSKSGNGDKSPPRTFTQAEVDSLLGKTRQEGRDRAVAGLLKETGAKDVESLKTTVQEAEEKRIAQLSELDKTVEEVKRLKPFEELAKEQEKSLAEYKKAVEKYVETVMETMEVPDHIKPLLEQMDSLARLAYLTEHGAAFSKSATSTPPNSNVSAKGGGGKNEKDGVKKARQKYGIQ